MTQGILTSLFALLVVISSWPTVTQSDALDDYADFDIPALPMGDALLRFSEQIGVQVMFSGQGFDARSPEIKGYLRSRDALLELLSGTDLRFDMTSRYLVIRPAAREPDPENTSLPDDLIGSMTVTESAIAPLGVLIVTGTHLRAGDSGGVQFVVLDREAMAGMGYSTPEDVIRSLPLSLGGGSTEDSDPGDESSDIGGRASSRSSAQSLGTQTVLLNGRPLPFAGGETEALDLSGIPLAMVSRVEVLTEGASAIYGGMDNAVNFIMRDDYSGAQTQARVSSATEGTLSETEFSQLFGQRWSTGHLVLSYDFAHRDALPATERNLSADSDLRRFGGDDFSLQRRNLNTQRDLSGEKLRHSAFLSLSQVVGDAIKLSVDAFQANRKNVLRKGGLPTMLSIPASNPFRVAPVDGAAADTYSVDYDLGSDLGARMVRTTAETLSISAAANARLSRAWTLTGSLSYASDDDVVTESNLVKSSALQAALADTDPLTAFDPFGDGSNNNPQTLDRIRGSTSFADSLEMTGAGILVEGVLFDIPGGRPRVSLGADYSIEQSHPHVRAIDGTQFTAGPKRERVETAWFAEMSIPIVTRRNRRPGIENLTLSLAARYEDYSDYGSGLSPRLGLKWSPLEELSVYGSYAKSFRPPELRKLDESGNTSYIASLPDPQTFGTDRSSVLVWTGDNAELAAETAKNWRAGVLWEPHMRWADRLDLAYFDVEYADKIQAYPSVDSALVRPDRLGTTVIRNPPLTQREDVCRRSTYIGNFANQGDCLSAPIVAIVDSRYINTDSARVRGADLSASKAVETDLGLFGFDALLSYLLAYDQTPDAKAATFRLLDTVGNPQRFRAKAGISWDRSGFGARVAVNHAGSYRDPWSKPARDVAAWTTFDLQLNYEADTMNDNWFSGCKFTLAVQNVFDADPPFVNNFTGLGYDGMNADLVKRFISLEISKSW